jgi:hypothetical protein
MVQQGNRRGPSVKRHFARWGSRGTGMNQVYQQMLETEDYAKAAKDMQGASHRIGAHLLAPLIPTNLSRYL